jgi:hypothetical protein
MANNFYNLESSIFPIISAEPTLYGVHGQRLAHKRMIGKGR